MDILKEKVDLINHKKSPIVDKEIEEYLATKDLHLTAMTDPEEAFRGAEFVIIATPTNLWSGAGLFWHKQRGNGHWASAVDQSICHDGD